MVLRIQGSYESLNPVETHPTSITAPGYIHTSVGGSSIYIHKAQSTLFQVKRGFLGPREMYIISRNVYLYTYRAGKVK